MTQQDRVRDADCVLVGSTLHRSALKILRTGCIKLATRVMVREVREVRVETDGRAKEGQAGGIEDPGVVAAPAQGVGMVTKAPREDKVKWCPTVKARDLSRKLQ